MQKLYVAESVSKPVSVLECPLMGTGGGVYLDEMGPIGRGRVCRWGLFLPSPSPIQMLVAMREDPYQRCRGERSEPGTYSNPNRASDLGMGGSS